MTTWSALLVPDDIENCTDDAQDRMRGLFHPNAAGARVLACRVSAAMGVPC